jgi:uncharacterized membrane protein
MFDTLVAVHVIGIILWMGGLFMLTRHVGMHSSMDTAPQEDLKVYESKSYYMSVLPGLLLTLGTGLYMLIDGRGLGIGYYLKAGEGSAWGSTFHVKLMLIVILLIADQFFHMRMRRLHNKGEGKRGLFMAIHGIVGLSFIIIVLLMKGRYLA